MKISQHIIIYQIRPQLIKIIFILYSSGLENVQIVVTCILNEIGS